MSFDLNIAVANDGCDAFIDILVFKIDNMRYEVLQIQVFELGLDFLRIELRFQ